MLGPAQSLRGKGAIFRLEATVRPAAPRSRQFCLPLSSALPSAIGSVPAARWPPLWQPEDAAALVTTSALAPFLQQVFQ
jgi:hypothetical protein